MGRAGECTATGRNICKYPRCMYRYDRSIGRLDVAYLVPAAWSQGASICHQRIVSVPGVLINEIK
jgi:hypothetical protein